MLFVCCSLAIRMRVSSKRKLYSRPSHPKYVLESSPHSVPPIKGARVRTNPLGCEIGLNLRHEVDGLAVCALEPVAWSFEPGACACSLAPGTCSLESQAWGLGFEISGLEPLACSLGLGLETLDTSLGLSWTTVAQF